jgi:hypothetical protein
MRKLSTTPEGWAAEKERELELRRARGDLELVDPKYDNWLLWVNWLLWIEYQRRILGKSLSPTSRVKAGMVLTANELRVSAARSRRGSSVGRTRGVVGCRSAMEISPRTRGAAGGDDRVAAAT